MTEALSTVLIELVKELTGLVKDLRRWAEDEQRHRHKSQSNWHA
jgi:hypothetical protein